MRIISGKYGGQYLVNFKADHIRPTTDRVKETLFNILQNQVEGARALDLFCGTGNLGIEALSRGAAEVLFVDLHPKSLAILKQNIEKLKVEEPHNILRKDVFSFLAGYQEEAFDLIFVDPPFTEAIAHDVMLKMGASKVFKETTLIAIESGRREKIEDDYGPLYRYNHREYGDKILSLFKVRP